MPEKNIAEANLYNFWEKSEYFSQPLLSVAGKRIDIIRRGKINHDAGPDFNGIVIRIDGKIVHGDCEIHISPLDWQRHGHAKDAAYNQTCLHIAMDTVPAPPILLENGLEVEQLLIPRPVFLQFQSQPQNDPQHGIAESCALSHESHQKKVTILQNAGRARLRQKSRIFAERYASVSWDQLIYEGICRALGYNKNTQPFSMLSRLVPIDLLFQEMLSAHQLSPEQTVAALLFGAAGFLEPQQKSVNFSREVKEYTEGLTRFWNHARHVLQINPMQRAQWQFFRLRPQNFPTRRIAGIAGLVVKFRRLGILEFLLHDLRNEKLSNQEINRSLGQFFTVEADPFWRHHYDFKPRQEQGNSTNLGMLIGKNRAADLLINIVFPIVAFFAEETGDGLLQNKLLELYSAHPRLQDNSITRQMQNKLKFGKRHMPAGAYNVCLQQGLHHLADNLCEKATCRRCLEFMLPSASREEEN